VKAVHLRKNHKDKPKLHIHRSQNNGRGSDKDDLKNGLVIIILASFLQETQGGRHDNGQRLKGMKQIAYEMIVMPPKAIGSGLIFRTMIKTVMIANM
jgi:hypothetical protein